jgi:glycosyltransferase involved in cell wall biosynthesis
LSDLPFVYGWKADNSACGYYRVEQPLTEYIRRGGQAEYSTELSPEMRERADVIIGQRIVGDPPSAGWQSLCKKDTTLCVFELDDDLFNIDASNIAFTSFTPPYLANLRRNIEVSHAVTVTTARLADRLSVLNDNIHVVPNCVPAWLTEHERPRPEVTTVGWAGGVSHVMDWDEAVKPIGRYLTRNPGVHFHSVGGLFPSMLKWPREQLRSTRWVDSVEEYYKVIDFDVGVIPLRPHIFNQSKSYIKALEYAALGIPTVASNTGPYENFVLRGKTGYLVDYEHQWAGITHDLVQNPVLRAKMGYEARELAKAHTIEGNLDKWYPAWGIS